MFMFGVLYMKCMKSCVVLMRIWSPLYRMERYHHVPYERTRKGVKISGSIKLGTKMQSIIRYTGLWCSVQQMDGGWTLTTTTGRMTIKANP